MPTPEPEQGSEQGTVEPSAEVLPGDGAGEWLVRVGGRDQSAVDLTDPTRLLFDYVRRIGDVVDAVAAAGDPLRVLHVGGAGLTVPRYVAATRPGSRQVVLEPDAALTGLVRERLPLPRRSGISVRPVGGAAGVRELRDGWAHLVVVDAFEDGEVPPDLLDAAFATDVRRVLAGDGVLAFNVADGRPFPQVTTLLAALDRAGLGSPTVGAEPATLRGRRAGNLLVVARAGGPVGDVRTALVAAAARSHSPYRVLHGVAAADRFRSGRR